jgi:hypothetical protein
MHVLQTTPEQHDLGLEIVATSSSLAPRQLGLPWPDQAREPKRRENARHHLWADEESLQASADAGKKLGELTAETVGVTRLALEDYEVTLFDVSDS